MRPTSRHQLWKHPRGNGQTKCYTCWKKRGLGVNAAPVRDHTTCRRSVGGVRLTKAPTFFTKRSHLWVPIVCSAMQLQSTETNTSFHPPHPTSTSSCYSNTLTNHWFIHCFYTSQSPPLRPSAPPSSRPHRHKHPRTAELTLRPWRPPLSFRLIGRPAVRLSFDDFCGAATPQTLRFYHLKSIS